jgi:hypothetical protein
MLRVETQTKMLPIRKKKEERKPDSASESSKDD